MICARISDTMILKEMGKDGLMSVFSMWMDILLVPPERCV